MQAVRDNRRFILIGLVLLVLLCLVVVLIIRIFFEENGAIGEIDTPTPAPTPTQETIVEVQPDEEPTATPTRVVADASPTARATDVAQAGTPTSSPTLSPTPTPTSAALASPVAPPATRPGISLPPQPSSTTPATPRPPARRVEQLLENGAFEAGFDQSGVALNWKAFKSNGVVAIFGQETAPPFVKSGSTAQRITLVQATQGDRYAGIYQPIEVVANQPYRLTLNGQIRTGLGDIDASSYGYRMEYTVDYDGTTNWMRIPKEEWIELPWDEQPFEAPQYEFLTYTTTLTPTSDNLTLFIRAWNKWPDPGEAQYTLDSLSLVGLSPAIEAPLTRAEEEQLVDGGLPTTGSGDGAGILQDGRFWGALLILLLLASGAIYRARWES